MVKTKFYTILILLSSGTLLAQKHDLPYFLSQAQNISLPAGYSIEYGGADQEQQKVFKELMMILISAILLVFVVILFLCYQLF